MDDSLFEALDRLPSRTVQGSSFFSASNITYCEPRTEHMGPPPESSEVRSVLGPSQRYEDYDDEPAPYSFDEPLDFEDYGTSSRTIGHSTTGPDESTARGLVEGPARLSRQAQPPSYDTRLSFAPKRSGRSMYGYTYDEDREISQSRRSGYENVSNQPGVILDDGFSGFISPSSPAYQASQRRTTIERSNSQLALRQSTKFDRMPSGQHTRVIELPPPQTNLRSHGSRPVAQGIELVAVSDLPDRFRPLFSFMYFNAIQSKCFAEIYGTYHNFVLSSPTGSGKTVVFELAICQLAHQWRSGTYKVVYMAPTKALCAERKRDWKSKFSMLGLECEELTGDSDIASLKNVQSADIIITTPEKWDSMTRKWKDHERLVRLIKLFLVDEVHILNNDRGAALEAVISRMKSMGSNIRFVALSATVPNLHDIAAWLGRDQDNPNIPATCEKFGEEFRPVRLQKHVCGYQANSNVYAFDSTLVKKLPDVISKHSRQKPIMIFCFTRKSCLDSAKFLADWWSTSSVNQRYWPAPRRAIKVDNKELRSTVSAGVAFHHGGLNQADRVAVEKGYLEGDVNVICCTSTLSVGVNLPCHMVIIKNTSSYEGNAVKEYSDLDVMQMIGRAGRPQFDDSAVAVIMTRMPQVARYEQMVSGQEQLESCLHLNLIEHMNAEVGLGTVTDLHTAKRWLQGTFLCVRLQANPRHYRIEGDSNAAVLDERLHKICATAISQLTEHDLVRDDARLYLSEYGEAMARYYINIETMIAIMDLVRQPRPSEILSTIAQAYEFREIRLRAGEKQLYKDLNASPNIRFPIKVDIALPAHKVSLLIQSVLGGADDIVQDSSHRLQYNIDQAVIFQHVHRLIRCIVDCQTCRQDAVGVRNALLLSRSFAAKVWDDSPNVLRQIDGIGPVAVKRLVSANINSFEDIEHAQSGRLERALSKNSAFVHKLLANVKTFPKLHISVQLHSQPLVKAGECVSINLAVELGFLNDKPPRSYQDKPVYVIMLAETSDGHLLQFSRTSALQLAKAAPITFKAQLKRPTQFINCYAMCDGLAGTLKQVRLDPKIPDTDFRTIKESGAESLKEQTLSGDRTEAREAKSKTLSKQQATRIRSEDWGDGGLDDHDFVQAAELDTRFIDIDVVTDGRGSDCNTAEHEAISEPVQLENGKWRCAHQCNDKTACKHICCKEGVSKKPKRKKSKPVETAAKQPSKTQTTLNMKPKKGLSVFGPPGKKNAPEHVDLSRDTSTQRLRNGPTSAVPKSLLRLHDKTVSSARVPMATDQVSESCLDHARDHDMTTPQPWDQEDSSFAGGFDDFLLDDLPDPSELKRDCQPVREPPASSEDEDYSYMEEDPELLDAVLIGAEDSSQLKGMSLGKGTMPDELLDSSATLIASRPSNDGPAWPSSESALFVSQVPMPRAGQPDSGFDTGLSKRRAEDNDLYQSAPKRVRSGALNDAWGESLEGRKPPPVVDNEVTESVLLDSSVSKDLEMAELRAWVAAEFGDSVELIDSMEEAETT